MKQEFFELILSMSIIIVFNINEIILSQIFLKVLASQNRSR